MQPLAEVDHLGRINIGRSRKMLLQKEKPMLDCGGASTGSNGADVTACYIVADLERLRQPMQWITDYILAKGI